VCLQKKREKGKIKNPSNIKRLVHEVVVVVAAVDMVLKDAHLVHS